MPLESVAVFELSVGFSEAYNTGILQIWYLSVGMHLILFRVEFKDGLSISVLKDMATRYKVTTGNRKVLKKYMSSKAARPHYFTQPFQTFVCVAVGQDLAHRCMSQFTRRLEHIQKTLKNDLRQWSSRHRHRRYRYRRRRRRRRRRSESSVEKR
ncbi:hypothetical protein [Absidia glauca]|uniref:Uncharacterized protein n=1 Tax=Absidia glauca TaxID=4829 RepID=A0A163J486_ABSGL|nr:hypothetical protein [Absidia glauca]